MGDAAPWPSGLQVTASSTACYVSDFAVDFTWQGAADGEQRWLVGPPFRLGPPWALGCLPSCREHAHADRSLPAQEGAPRTCTSVSLRPAERVHTL